MSIKYNGTTQYANAPNSIPLGTRQTLMCWMKLIFNPDGQDIKGIVGGTFSLGTISFDILYHRMARYIRCQIFNSGLTHNFTFDSASNIFEWGYWFHVAIVRAGTTAYIYVNGVEVATLTNLIFTDATKDMTSGLFLGHYFAADRRAKGEQFDVRLYDEAVSFARIVDIVDNGHGCEGDNDGLIGRWQMREEEDTASTIIDTAGSNNANAVDDPDYVPDPFNECVTYRISNKFNRIAGLNTGEAL